MGAIKRRDFVRLLGVLGSASVLGMKMDAKTDLDAATQHKALADETFRLWEEQKGKRYALSESEIEREIRKHDPWISDFISKISFAYIDLPGYDGTYFPNKKILAVPYLQHDKSGMKELLVRMRLSLPVETHAAEALAFWSEDAPSFEKLPDKLLSDFYTWLRRGESGLVGMRSEVLGSVDHELYHALVSGPEGLLSASRYSGPKLCDLRSFVADVSRRGQGKKDLELLAEAHLGGAYDVVMAREHGLQRFLGRDLSTAPAAFAGYDRVVRQKEKLLSLQIPRALMISQDGVIRIPEQELTSDESREFARKFGVKSIGQIAPSELVPISFSPKTNIFYFRELPYFWLVTNSTPGGVACAVLEDGKAKLMRELGVPLRDLGAFRDYIADREFQAVLVNEYMARAFDSLYSVCLRREPENPRFLLGRPRMTPAMIDLFSEFRYNGEPAFRKALEKNRLALELMRAGKPFSGLQYATSYSSGRRDGRDYSWPENEFRLKGPLPEFKPGFS